jgi:hypothetical protein
MGCRLSKVSKWTRLFVQYYYQTTKAICGEAKESAMVVYTTNIETQFM